MYRTNIRNYIERLTGLVVPLGLSDDELRKAFYRAIKEDGTFEPMHHTYDDWGSFMVQGIEIGRWNAGTINYIARSGRLRDPRFQVLRANDSQFRNPDVIRVHCDHLYRGRGYDHFYLNIQHQPDLVDMVMSNINKPIRWVMLEVGNSADYVEIA